MALLVLLALITIGVLNHYPICENDLFWMIRAGGEIVHGHAVQSVERWSSTAAGTPWHNFEWLSTVIFWAWSRLTPDDRYLPTLRAALASILAFETWVLSGAHLPRRVSARVAAATRLSLIALVFLAARSSIQLRPDLFGLIIFAGLLIALSSALSPGRKIALAAASLLLWANLHAGTVLLGVGVAWTWLLTAPPRTLTARARIALGALFGALALATPLGWVSLEVLWKHTASYDWHLTMNPDHRAFGLDLLDPTRSGYGFWWWLILTAAAIPAVMASDSHSHSHARARDGHPPEAGENSPYRARAFALLFGAFITAVAFARVRASGYCVIFFLPLTAAVAAGLLETLCSKLQPRFRVAALVLVPALAWLSPALMLARAHLPAFGVFETLYPVASARFLDRERPPGALFNLYDHGGYLIDRLPAYPVALDSREVIFRDFLVEMEQIFVDPTAEKFARFWQKHGFQILLLPAPTRSLANGVDAYALLAPPAQWGLVFADNASVVYVKRVPQNAPLLAAHEYRALYRVGPSSHNERELDRCLSEVPTNTYCLAGKAAVLDKAGRTSEARLLRDRAAAVATF